MTKKKKPEPDNPFVDVIMLETFIQEVTIAGKTGKVIQMVLGNKDEIFHYNIFTDDNQLEMLAQSCMQSIVESSKVIPAKGEVTLT